MRDAAQDLADLVAADAAPDVRGGEDHRTQDLRVAGFGKELVGGALDLEEEVGVGLARQDDADGGGMLPHDAIQEFRPVHARHAHVGDHHVEGGLGQGLQALEGAVHENHVPDAPHVPQEPLEALENQWFIVDEENPGFRGHGAPWRLLYLA